MATATLTATAQTAQTAHNATASSAVQQPNLQATPEARGFALYVGLGPDKIAEGDPQLGEIVAEIKRLVAKLAPAADTYATVALAPKGKGGRDLDVVRLALGEPGARAAREKEIAEAKAAKSADLDRAAAGVELDFSRARVLLDNVQAPLTYREFSLLRFLVLREGRTVGREELIEGVWAGSDEAPSARTVDVHVRRLRVKLGKYQDIVRTVRGEGYRFDRHADVRIIAAAAPSPDLV